MGCRPNLLGDFILKPLPRFAPAFKLIEAKQSQYESSMTKKNRSVMVNPMTERF